MYIILISSGVKKIFRILIHSGRARDLIAARDSFTQPPRINPLRQSARTVGERILIESPKREGEEGDSHDRDHGFRQEPDEGEP